MNLYRLLGLLGLVLGCGGTIDDLVDAAGETDGAVDAGAKPDAGGRFDAANRRDGGALDARVGRDTGVRVDAGARVDAGMRDAGMDASNPVDSGNAVDGGNGVDASDAGSNGVPDAATSTVVASPDSLVADGAAVSTIVITVLDAASNPVAGVDVLLEATGFDRTLTQPAGPTDGGGQTSGTLTSTGAETVVVTATVDPGGIALPLLQQPSVVFVPGSPDAAGSSVEFSPDDVPADGVAVSTITVTVRDANGNLVPGQNVSLAATGIDNTLVQPPSPTDAVGNAIGSIASTTAEAKTITATVDGLDLLETPTVTFVVP